VHLIAHYIFILQNGEQQFELIQYLNSICKCFQAPM